MKKDSGQVLISGVIMLTLLLLTLLYMFDVHNVIRGKLKLETGQQAAALAGAAWQKNSLNLIGEINLFKACSALLEGDDHWTHPLPDVPEDKNDPEYQQKRKERRDALQGRIDLLTEMQTRVSFIGPLIGFAAAQQAAKANGLPAARREAMYNYLRRVSSSVRYGGTENTINNYRWRDPYIMLLSEITERGIAVYPNIRTASSPVVDPPELANEEFYAEILRHLAEIEAGDPPEQSSWLALRKFVKEWSHLEFQGKWWNIDYTLNRFPDECEIFTLGVRNGFSSYSNYLTYDDHNWNITSALFRSAAGSPDIQNSIYRSAGDLPSGVNMKWFCYDESWYPEYYRSASSQYEDDHYDYWFGGKTLRRKVKKQYRYEGPAAYVEGSDVYIDRAVRQRVRRKRAEFITKKERSSVRVGPKHESQSDNESYSTSYRPGAIAKTLGELANGNPPVSVPLVMPVFDKVVLMPTYMPIPYGFSVLRDHYSILATFLSWLAAENSLTDPEHPLPAGCENFLKALKTLTDPEFRSYGYNHHCTVNLTLAMLRKWDNIRKQYVYTKTNRSGLGWLQEPKLCIDTANADTIREQEVYVEDHINGGKALRIYTDRVARTYYVVDSTGKIITNDDLDPTLMYNHGGGTCNCQNCCGFGGKTHKPDTQKGPVRL